MVESSSVSMLRECAGDSPRLFVNILCRYNRLIWVLLKAVDVSYWRVIDINFPSLWSPTQVGTYVPTPQATKKKDEMDVHTYTYVHKREVSSLKLTLAVVKFCLAAASGAFSSPHTSLPVTAYFFDLNDSETAPSPYLVGFHIVITSYIRIGSLLLTHCLWFIVYLYNKLVAI